VTSLADQFCPNVHDAPITAAAYDPHSGTVATADASGLVAVQRPGETTPGLLLEAGAPIHGALALVRGGALVAFGDDEGSVYVFRTSGSDEPVFEEVRGGQAGRVRAMRGLALSPEGRRLASIAADGLLRLWDLTTGEREEAWQGFGGRGIAFDAYGDRLLAVGEDGQPRVVDLRAREGVPMDRIQMETELVLFTADNTHVLAAGPAGISMLRLLDGALVGSFATRGGSGIIGVCLSPDSAQIAAVTRRSNHIFNLPDLDFAESTHHGAPNPSGAAVWLPSGIRVGGEDGLMHDGSGGAAVAPVIAVGGFGAARVAIHGDSAAVWSSDRRVRRLPLGMEPLRALVERDGRYLAVQSPTAPLKVVDLNTGQEVFSNSAKTIGALDIALGGAVVAARLRSGGLRWWDLRNNLAFELDWPRAMALSGSGSWLAVVTPRGDVRVLNTTTGQDDVAPPAPLADLPIKQLAFINRRPELLVIDTDGVLGHYDLAEGIRAGAPAEGRDIIDFNVEIDRIWGLTGGRYCMLRLPEGDGATIITVDLENCDVVGEVSGLFPGAEVDPETGHILEPTRAGGLLERDNVGNEVKVLRSLPGDQWIAFGERGILDASEEAGGALG
jgi:WD40 repeat protein